MKSRREFLTQTTLAVLGASVASYGQAQNSSPSQQQQLPPGAPPAFGTAPAVGPEVSPGTFAEAEKLVQVEYTPAQLTECAGNWRMAMAPLYERRTGPHKVSLEPTLAPATLWDPVLPGEKSGPAQNRFVRSKTDPGPLPANDEDIAFAPVTQLSRWIEQRKLTSERLTNIYLTACDDSIPSCVASSRSPRTWPLQQAKQADRGDRRREVSRAAARHSLGRKGSARHRRHSHHLRRRAVPQSRAHDKCRGRAAACTMPAPCWSPSSAWARWRSTTSGSAARR